MSSPTASFSAKRSPAAWYRYRSWSPTPSSWIWCFQPGRDGSTFGGYPLACVAGNAALDVIVDEDLAGRSAAKGAILKKKIKDVALASSHVKEVRGRGLFIGIEVKNGDAMVYCRKLLELGVLANDSHGHTIRISPPLIINDEEIDYLVERLEKVLVD